MRYLLQSAFAIFSFHSMTTKKYTEKWINWRVSNFNLK